MKMSLPFRQNQPGAIGIEWVLGLIAMAAIVALMGWMLLAPEAWYNSGLMLFVRETGLRFLAPEVMILLVILAGVLLVSFSKTQAERQETWWLATTGTFLTLVCLSIHGVFLVGQVPQWESSPVFHDMFSFDLFSVMVRWLLVFGTLLVLLSCRSFVDRKVEVPGEFYVIMLSALLGGMMLSGATNLIMVFVALETLSISSYILVGYMRGDVRSAEAGLKYLLYGGMATAILLFGLSMLYGMTGSVSFGDIATALAGSLPVDPLVVAIMAVMILSGIAFKLSAAPFHMWAPDAYEGAPTPVVAFLSVISKIAAFALAIRLFFLLFGPMQGWMGLLSVLAVLSMVIGNVVALTQRNFKRLLAYSTVAHVGYLLLGLAILNVDGLSSLLYYLVTYLFMNLGAFAVVTWFEESTGSTEISAYAGLVRKRPWVTFVLTVMLLSLAGIPITAGFFGKFFLFQAVANAGTQHLWLVVVALLTSTISLYYYLNVVRLMIIAEPSPEVAALPERESSQLAGQKVAVAFSMLVCLLSTLALGLWAQPALELSRTAVSQLSHHSVTTTAKLPTATRLANR